MATNILFIDVDDTLVTSIDGTQYIPPSALDAMARARSRGSRVYLCTGRSLAEALTVGEVPIDGIIGAAGGFVLDGQTMVAHETLSEADVAAIERFLLDHGITYYLESNEGLLFEPTLYAAIGELWHIKEGAAFWGIAHSLEAHTNRSRINKISYYSPTGVSFEEVSAALGSRFTLVKNSWGLPNTSGGEISRKGINKATAIAKLLEYLDLPSVRTFGFGDSMNDIEMLQACDEAIVMGDARHGVEKYATFVTKPLLEDGLAYAMRHFGLA